MLYSKVKVLIEGIEIPVAACTISTTIRQQARATFVIEGRKSITKFYPFSHVEIYYYSVNTWYLAFVGVMVGYAPQTAASSQNYTVSAISIDWLLTRLHFGYLDISNPTIANATTHENTGNAGIKLQSALLNFATDQITNTVFKAEDEVINSLADSYLKAVGTILENEKIKSAIKKAYTRILQRASLNKFMSSFKTPVSKFKEYYNLQALQQYMGRMTNNTTDFIGFLNTLVNLIFYDYNVNLFPTMAEDRLIYIHLHPFVPYADIPACNVIPPVASYINYNRNFTNKPTRISMTYSVLGNNDEATKMVVTLDPNGELEEGKEAEMLTKEEEKLGILPLIISSEFGGMILNDESAVKNTTLDAFQKTVAQHQLWMARQSTFSISASFPLMPQLLVGQPCSILHYDQMFVGYLQAISHDFIGNTTTITMGFVQEIDEMEKIPLPMWVPDYYENNTDDYYKYLGTKTAIKLHGGGAKEQLLSFYKNNYLGKNQIEIINTMMSMRELCTIDVFQNIDVRAFDDDFKERITSYKDDIAVKASFAGTLPS